MNSIDGPFLKSSTLTYRTETGFRISLRPVFFLLLAMSRFPLFSGYVVLILVPHGWFSAPFPAMWSIIQHHMVSLMHQFASIIR